MRTRISAYAIIILCCLNLSATAQKGKVYSVTGTEWIISFADITENNIEATNIIRFSPVVNLQELVNWDLSDHLGFYLGIDCRNVGFIYDVPNSNLRKKVRTYNVGVPVAIKIGNMNGFFLYGGYELELPVNYKEKTFANDDKTEKFNVWFSSRTPTIYNALFAGIQFPYGTSIKFKYYMDNFYRKDYTEQDASGEPVHPYQNMNVNVFYISLNFLLLKNKSIYQSKTASSPE
jgi:hypothetical protein